MKNGYLGELDARGSELGSHKLALEALYMNPNEEKVIMADETLKKSFEDAIDKTDVLGPAYASTAKSVKMAIDSGVELKKTMF